MPSNRPQKYFGTDGIRGTWKGAVINPEFAKRLGCALGAFLKKRMPDRPAAVYIGRDTRASGDPLTKALREGLSSTGALVCDLGIVPTPAVALVTAHQSADMGLMVTASHNPASDNGYKVLGPGGLKLTLEDEQLIEAELAEVKADAAAVAAEPDGHCFDGLGYYINFMRAMLDEGCLNGRTLVVDLANGATTASAPAVFSRWGGRIHLLGNQPDGHNINDGVGSEHPEKLAAAVCKHGAELGIAFDGDGDRLVIVDEKGAAVPGEIILALLARAQSARNALGNNTLVTTVHSNGGLDRALAQFGVKTERTDVGDRNVLYRMRELGATLGGEASGHIIFSDWVPSGDGLLSAIQFISLLIEQDVTTSSLASAIDLFPQVEGTLRVAAKPPLSTLPLYQTAYQSAAQHLADGRGRILVRYSGTEPKLRFLVEAEDPATAQAVLDQLMQAAASDLQIDLS